MTDWHNELGGGPPSGTIQITLFIASVDRQGKPIEQNFWREEALCVMGKLFRGATAFPPGLGVWRDDENDGKLVFDETILITSYVSQTNLNQESIKQLRFFLHRYGRESNQGEVGLVVDGNYIGIVDYDKGEQNE